MAWGIINWLLGRQSKPAQRDATSGKPIQLTKGGFFEVVGESFYQDHLASICGGKHYYSAAHQCRAFLVPEPDNPEDPNAIRIVINRGTVGHLAREHAIEYLQYIGPRASTCEAKIVGGWDDGVTTGYFGVKLKIKWPPKERKRDGRA